MASLEESIRVWPVIYGLKKPGLFKAQNKFKSWSQRTLETSLLLCDFDKNIISLSIPLFFGINQAAADIILLHANCIKVKISRMNLNLRPQFLG